MASASKAGEKRKGFGWAVFGGLWVFLFQGKSFFRFLIGKIREPFSVFFGVVLFFVFLGSFERKSQVFGGVFKMS